MFPLQCAYTCCKIVIAFEMFPIFVYSLFWPVQQKDVFRLLFMIK